MYSALLIIAVSFIVLSWGANKLITGASALARNLGVSPLLIGLTIIALGTSAPEIFVTVTASLKGHAGLAIGNAIGSNIANICLVIGIAAMVRPLTIRSEILNYEYPILLLIMFGLLVLIIDNEFSFTDGILLLLGLCVFLGWLIWTGMNSRKSDPMVSEYQAEIPTDLSTARASIYVLIGLILLPISSNFLVLNATFIAQQLGISETTIGLTLVAIGTSLPEVAASVAAMMKNEDDIVMGNTLGSNMFNILAVLPFPGIIQPGALPGFILQRDVSFMFFTAVLLYFFAMKITRLKGFMLLSVYAIYLGVLVYTST